MLLIQYTTATGDRRVGILAGDTVTAIAGYATTLDLAKAAIAQGRSIAFWPTHPPAATPSPTTPSPPRAACWPRSTTRIRPTATSPAPA
jgi:hypothetical protein